MASVEEISQRIQWRLEELAEEGDRLRLAIEALGADNPHSGRTAGVRRAVRSPDRGVTWSSTVYRVDRINLSRRSY